jgi:mannose-6-phosphate isomerase
MNLIQLQPIYQTRVWGGRELATLFGRELPADGQPYGEAWEVVDRPEAQSKVQGGEFAGWSLHELWTRRKMEVFGAQAPDSERFPLLLKILDAREDLSIQVHPPAEIAASLNGEPKTEMWFIAEADAGASLAVGVQPGMTRERFAEALREGTVAEAVHRLPVVSGDYIFIPSGRLHAIGGGLVIFEIQQNSDTTYRVFDWNRVGLDGQPRQLHVEESLRCIDYTDTNPAVSHGQDGDLVSCVYFRTSQHTLAAGQELALGGAGEFRLLAVVSGCGMVGKVALQAGDHALVPADSELANRTLRATQPMVVLTIAFA